MDNVAEFIFGALTPYYTDAEASTLKRILLEYITGIAYPIFVSENKSLSESQHSKMNEILERLEKYEPIQYILGETEFYGLPFKVNRDTLIPRPETEELVELIINENRDRKVSILDIGTGSGCIAITLAKKLPYAEVLAWDFSQGALDVARKNAELNDVKIDFSGIDILQEYLTDRKFDIIVSNPPYVMESEKAEMQTNVLSYEPHSALFVPDNKALLFYERIANIALEILNDKGALYFEINRTKGEEIKMMLNQKGFVEISLTKDISGNDRIIKATYLT